MANDQHKKEIVSFERGNISTAERSSKQVGLLFHLLYLSVSHLWIYNWWKIFVLNSYYFSCLV